MKKKSISGIAGVNIVSAVVVAVIVLGAVIALVITGG